MNSEMEGWGLSIVLSPMNWLQHRSIRSYQIILSSPNGIQSTFKFTLGIVHFDQVGVDHVQALCPKIFPIIQGGFHLFIPHLDGGPDLFLVFLI